MTLTINIHSWILPVMITAVSLILVQVVAYSERNDSGFLSGLGTALVAAGGLIASAVAWFVWFLMLFIR